MPEMAGQEEPFPDPDNQSKMKRSCENAEHVGMFIQPLMLENCGPQANIIYRQASSRPMQASTFAMSSGADARNTTEELGLPP